MSAIAPFDTLLGYLATCGGCDRFEFHDTHGEPDPSAARAFAENLRSQYAQSLGSTLSVEQLANRVTVCAMPEPASV